MGNEFEDRPEHSAEYFGDGRDYWWNADYVELLAKRFRFHDVRDVLDVGCGIGHWGRALAPSLPADARLVGVDRESTWIEAATERAAKSDLAERFSYRVGDAARLPFPDASFDLVTCQTVLIHVPDPATVLAEMIRVARPGALVLAAEPNNAVNTMVLSSTRTRWSVDEHASYLRFYLTCERGKRASGQGDISLGERVPGLFARAGLRDLRTCLNDRADTVLPPYASSSERAHVEELRSAAKRRLGMWTEAQTKEWFLAGGGDESEFDASWARALQRIDEEVAAIERGEYECAGGGVVYVVAGRKAA